jgi:hypothetical protein
MARELVRRLACLSIIALSACAHAQEVGSRVPAEATDAVTPQPGSPDQGAQAQETAADDSTSTTAPKDKDIVDRFFAIFSQKEDPDGPINTDRPTFTPANTVVPPGRLQFESGFTYNLQQRGKANDNIYDLPELAMRYGVRDRMEFRVFWEGPTFAQPASSPGHRGTRLGGGSDMEVGFKWQLFAGNKDRKWIPTTALITSVIAPSGGSSPLSPGTAEPYIDPIYGWSIDLRAGFGLSGRPDDFFTGTGLSFRF